MEPGIRVFFKRLATTIAMFVLWMIINMVAGIKYKYALFEDGFTAGNIVFYIWAPASFAALIIFYIRLWKKPIENLHDNP
ncbi:hypothetical protein [Parafilimonas sp.]|uniref:hypothetical protein n=1 Tax=Parafilimonas sp. TaxID=1969739 RepID=UPI0039E5BD0F